VEADALLIMEKTWVINKGSLVLSKWHTMFNPLKEHILKHHLWMMMIWFPL